MRANRSSEETRQRTEYFWKILNDYILGCRTSSQRKIIARNRNETKTLISSWLSYWPHFEFGLDYWARHLTLTLCAPIAVVPLARRQAEFLLSRTGIYFNTDDFLFIEIYWSWLGEILVLGKRHVCFCFNLWEKTQRQRELIASCSNTYSRRKLLLF